MWRHFFKSVLISGFLIGLGIWLLSFNLAHLRTAQRLEQSSAEIDGLVISSSTRSHYKGGQTSTLVVEYVPTNQAAITKKFVVDGATYKAAVASGKARITYLPEDPQVSLITKVAVLPYQMLIGLGGLMVLSGLFCLAHLLMKRAKA